MNHTLFTDRRAEQATPHHLSQASSHLLIVDDLEVNRDLLARRIQRLGHTYAFAASGIEALEQMRSADFDLVLLDITMPGMDGYAALEQMKQDAKLSGVPVVMVTAIDDADSVVRCLELGADDYITKPFNPTVLKARIGSSLHKKRIADLNTKLLASLSREMLIAQRIQIGFLPRDLPQIAKWPLAALCVPAKQVGGDFYDAFLLPDGRLALVVADVCDKGVGAALYMALFRSLLRISLQQANSDEDSGHVLQRSAAFTNDYIATVHEHENMFATAFMAIVTPETGQLDYINAGHDTPLLQRCGTLAAQALVPEGLALGMMAGQKHSAKQTQLNAGDRLLVFSDGLTEAVNHEGTAFGEARLRAALCQTSPGPLSLIETIKAELDQHVGDCAPHDDLTMLCLFAHHAATPA